MCFEHVGLELLVDFYMEVLPLHPEFRGEVEGGDTRLGALGLGWAFRPGLWTGREQFIHPRTPPWDDPKSSSGIFSGRFSDVSMWRSWVTHFFQKRLPASLPSGLNVSTTEGRGVVGGDFTIAHLPFLTSLALRGILCPRSWPPVSAWLHRWESVCTYSCKTFSRV